MIHFFASGQHILRGLTPLRAVVTSVTMALCACSFAPEYQPSITPLPAREALAVTHHAQSDGINGTVSADMAHWWQSYQDNVLNQLVSTALTHNANLLIAAERVAESRAMLGGAEAQRYPLLSMQAMAGRLDAGDAIPIAKPLQSYSVAPVLSFEVDLWGRLANSAEAARQQLLAEEANARAVRLAVIAETISHYFAALALNEQVLVTQQTIDTRHKAMALQRTLFHEGLTDEFTLRQAEAELQSVESELPGLQLQQQQRLNALSVLSGATPEAIFSGNQLADVKRQRLPDLPPLPALTAEQVVSGRPDIIQAEHGIRAANADIGIAKAAYLPRISLSGLLGFGSDRVADLFSSAPASLAAGVLSGPIVDFGRARSQVQAAEARQKQAYLAYEQQLRVAFAEILDALTGYQRIGERLDVQEKHVATLNRTAELARLRFDEGMSSYLEVLDAERNLYRAETAMIESRRARLQTSIDLYKALGGGDDGHATAETVNNSAS